MLHKATHSLHDIHQTSNNIPKSEIIEDSVFMILFLLILRQKLRAIVYCKFLTSNWVFSTFFYATYSSYWMNSIQFSCFQRWSDRNWRNSSFNISAIWMWIFATFTFCLPTTIFQKVELSDSVFSGFLISNIRNRKQLFIGNFWESDEKHGISLCH